MARLRQRARGRQRGAAIVTVLLIVTLATVVVSSLFWREHVTVRSVENRLALAQTRWIERAAIDWARVILALDLRSSQVDHLNETWHVPVADTQLDETITGGARFDDRGQPPAMLAGQIFDAQARLNLNNLVLNGAPQPQEIEAFRRLLTLLSLSSSLADNLVIRLQRASLTPGTAEQPASGPTMLPMKRLADLREVPGFDADTVQALIQFAIFLPAQNRVTEININTAPSEVIAARLELDKDVMSVLNTARRFVEQRKRQGYFVDLGAAGSQFPGVTTLPGTTWSVSSTHFLLQGVIRFERVVSRTDTLLRRSGQLQRPEVNVVWQDRY